METTLDRKSRYELRRRERLRNDPEFAERRLEQKRRWLRKNPYKKKVVVPLAILNPADASLLPAAIDAIESWKAKKREEFRAKFRPLRVVKPCEYCGDSTKKNRRTELVLCYRCTRRLRKKTPAFWIVARRYGRKCWLCSIDLSDPIPFRKGSKPLPSMGTVDHVVPVTKGGSDRMENLRPCCFRCNVARSNGDPEEYRRRISG